MASLTTEQAAELARIRKGRWRDPFAAGVLIVLARRVEAEPNVQDSS